MSPGGGATCRQFHSDSGNYAYYRLAPEISSALTYFFPKYAIFSYSRGVSAFFKYHALQLLIILLEYVVHSSNRNTLYVLPYCYSEEHNIQQSHRKKYLKCSLAKSIQLTYQYQYLFSVGC